MCARQKRESLRNSFPKLALLGRPTAVFSFHFSSPPFPPEQGPWRGRRERRGGKDGRLRRGGGREEEGFGNIPRKRGRWGGGRRRGERVAAKAATSALLFQVFLSSVFVFGGDVDASPAGTLAFLGGLDVLSQSVLEKGFLVLRILLPSPISSVFQPAAGTRMNSPISRRSLG